MDEAHTCCSPSRSVAKCGGGSCTLAQPALPACTHTPRPLEPLERLFHSLAMATVDEWDCEWNTAPLPEDAKLKRAAEARGYIWWQQGYKLSWGPHEDDKGGVSLRLNVHDSDGKLLTPPSDFPATRIAGIGRTQFMAVSYAAATKYGPLGRATKQLFGFVPLDGHEGSAAFFEEAFRVFHPAGKEYLDAVLKAKGHHLTSGGGGKARNKRAKVEAPEDIVGKYRAQLDDPDNYNKRGITFPSNGDIIKLYHKVANKTLKEGKKVVKPFEETGFASDECMAFYERERIRPSTVGIYCKNGKRYSGDPDNIHSLTRAMFYVDFYRDAAHDNGTIAITMSLSRVQCFGMQLRDGSGDDVMDDFTDGPSAGAAKPARTGSSSDNDTVDDFVAGF